MVLLVYYYNVAIVLLSVFKTCFSFKKFLQKSYTRRAPLNPPLRIDYHPNITNKSTKQLNKLISCAGCLQHESPALSIKETPISSNETRRIGFVFSRINVSGGYSLCSECFCLTFQVLHVTNFRALCDIF